MLSSLQRQNNVINKSSCADKLDTLCCDTCRSFCQNQIEIDLWHRTLFGTIDDNDHDVFHHTVTLELEQEPLCLYLFLCVRANVCICVCSKFRTKLVFVVMHNAQGRSQPRTLHSYRYWKHGIRYTNTNTLNMSILVWTIKTAWYAMKSSLEIKHPFIHFWKTNFLQSLIAIWQSHPVLECVHQIINYADIEWCLGRMHYVLEINRPKHNSCVHHHCIYSKLDRIRAIGWCNVRLERLADRPVLCAVDLTNVASLVHQWLA